MFNFIVAEVTLLTFCGSFGLVKFLSVVLLLRYTLRVITFCFHYGSVVYCSATRQQPTT
jgi:hypothetical protein